MPCHSCEIEYTPQVKACLEVLASSALKEKSHKESSWEEKDSMVDLEMQKKKYKKKRQAVTQVWIPKGVIVVM